MRKTQTTKGETMASGKFAVIDGLGKEVKVFRSKGPACNHAEDLYGMGDDNVMVVTVKTGKVVWTPTTVDRVWAPTNELDHALKSIRNDG